MLPIWITEKIYTIHSLLLALKIGNVSYNGKKYLAKRVENAVQLFESNSFHENNPVLTTDEVMTSPRLLNSLLNDEITPSFEVEDDIQIEFHPCVEAPGKIVCIGLNYRKHAEETSTTPPGLPVLFSKYNDALAGHRQPVDIPPNVSNLDYEAELGIVIGKTAVNVDRTDALDHVFGYFPANDVSARDLQFLSTQWLLGKTLVGFAPIGPYITTTDEIPDPNSLDISLKLNGETRQHSNTADMIFHCDYLISYISHYFPLNPGDVILTGTPEGVIVGMPPEKRVWMKKGDETEVVIQKLGSLVTPFR